MVVLERQQNRGREAAAAVLQREDPVWSRLQTAPTLLVKPYNVGSFTLRTWFVSTSFRTCTLPEGHWISIFSI